MLQIVKLKSFRIGAVVALLVGIYAIAGFVIAPKLIRSALLEDIPKSIAATPTVGEIEVNPFRFQVAVNEFALAGTGGEKLVGFKRLFVDFQVSSIWHRAYTFANIDITAPQVSAVMGKDGALNLLQLRPKASSAPPPKPQQDGDAPLPALRIGSFKVLDGLVTYEDRSRPDVFAARLEPINFELRDFTTGVEGGKFTFTGASKLGERLEWHGHVSVDPLESDGEFQVNGLLAHTLWEYLQDQVNFAIDTGTIDVAGTYKFSVKNADTDNLNVAVSKVGLRDLAVRLKGSGAEAPPPWITVPALDVTGTTLDLAGRRVHVDQVALTGLKVVSWLEPDGSINLMKLAAPPAAGEPAPPKPATPTLTASTPAGPAPAPWALDLGEFDLREANLSTEDRGVSPAVKLSLAPLSLQVKGIAQDLAKPLALTLETRLNEAGSVSVNGEITPQPVLANLNVKLSDLDLAMLQPYVAQHTAMTLVGGKLGGDLKIHYGAEPKMSMLQVGGNVAVEKLHTIDNTLHDDFIDWDRLDILGLDYRHGPDRLDIDQVVARRLYARVIIEADESMNVKRVLEIPIAPPAVSSKTAPVPVAANGAARGAPGTGAAEPAPPKAAKSGNKGKHAATTPASAATPATASMPMAIKKIVVQASQANFTDMSVLPNFSAGIQSLEGSVTGLSSAPGSRAKVDLHGGVDKFSPVTIGGVVNVLGPLYTDITLGFHNISLAVFNPYSGKFAGYNVTKGKLTTDLHYKVDGRKLDAQHHVVIEDLEFGDKTASKDAVSLPIKLAVSLLKDRNGVIDLDVPVTGSLDDPQFRLGPIIWKVFVNVLEKAVTAPFALLGSLFGGGPDIQFIDFRPGDSTLDAAAADKAKTMVNALAERPQLKIDVPIGVVPDVDRPALIETAFRTELSSAQSSKGAPKKAAATAGGAPPAYDQLDPATQLELLTRIYAKDFGGEPKFPDSVTGLKSKPEVTSAKLDFLGQAIRGHIAIGDGDLRTLGQQRAQALQTALLSDPRVAPERVFLVANDKATAQGGAVRLELTLE